MGLVSTLLAISALVTSATAQGSSNVQFGPGFWLRPYYPSPQYPENAWVREAVTTLVLPAPTNPQLDRLALWPGMMCSKGDLIQAIAVSFSDPGVNCGGTSGQWCTMASTLEGTQLGGKYVPADSETHLTMRYTYNDSTDKYDQTVTMDGKVVSTLSTSSGKAGNWQTAVECQDNACSGTSAPHQYLDTTITLNEADPTLGSSLLLQWANTSGFASADGGKTWTVKIINIQGYNFSNTSNGVGVASRSFKPIRRLA